MASSADLLAKFGCTANPVKAALWPPLPAADGLDRVCRPTVVCQHEIDGKVWPRGNFTPLIFVYFQVAVDSCKPRVHAFPDKVTFESAKAAKMSSARRPLAVVVSIWGPAPASTLSPTPRTSKCSKRAERRVPNFAPYSPLRHLSDSAPMT
jgi:hypothetical protein